MRHFDRDLASARRLQRPDIYRKRDLADFKYDLGFNCQVQFSDLGFVTRFLVPDFIG